MKSEVKTKKCARCGEIKPITEFYRKKYTNTYASYCQPCKRELQSTYPDSRKKIWSATPHENKVIRYLRNKGIYAIAGKARLRSRFVDVIAFGCVYVEVKQGELQHGRQFIFRFTPAQVNEGIKGDIVCLLIPGREDSYHFLPSSHPIFYKKDGTLKTGISYVPNSTHGNALITDAFMESCKDNYQLIQDVYNELKTKNFEGR